MCLHLSNSPGHLPLPWNGLSHALAGRNQGWLREQMFETLWQGLRSQVLYLYVMSTLQADSSCAYQVIVREALEFSARLRISESASHKQVLPCLPASLYHSAYLVQYPFLPIPLHFT